MLSWLYKTCKVVIKSDFSFLLDVEGGYASENLSMLNVNKLEDLSLIICHLNKKVLKIDSYFHDYFTCSLE